MRTIFAFACGLRTKTAWVVKGILRSSTKFPLPVTRRGSSRRLMLLPKKVSAMAGPRGLLHGLDDVHIARATADVSLEPGANLGFGRIRVLLQQVARRDDHS